LKGEEGRHCSERRGSPGRFVFFWWIMSLKQGWCHFNNIEALLESRKWWEIALYSTSVHLENLFHKMNCHVWIILHTMQAIIQPLW
jgi:hypothetical protein